MWKKLFDLMLEHSSSGAWKANLIDFAKTIRVGLFVGAGATVAYVIENAANYDLGKFEPLVIMGLTALGEFLFRLKRDNTKV